jgi:hypothetical protein
MRWPKGIRGFLTAAVCVGSAFTPRAQTPPVELQAGAEPRCAATLSHSDLTLCAETSGSGPSIAFIESKGMARFPITGTETIPATVERGGKSLSVQWIRKPELDRIANGRIEFVYESIQPHLRLNWIWEARSDSGAMEHRITVENLGKEELWLPMLDSLRLAISYDNRTALDQGYVEKGANTPSDQGTHVNAIEDGYHWTGKSSTYALPVGGQTREIIPA